VCRPNVVRAGEQACLWADSTRKVTRRSCQSDTRGSCQNDTVQSHSKRSPVNDHEDGVSQKRGDEQDRGEHADGCRWRKWPGRDVRLPELRSLKGVCALFERAAAAGLVSTCDHDRIWFFSLAAEAVSKRSPVGWLIRSVHRGQRRFELNEACQRAASETLRAARERGLIG
jgi:hypothetical protein